MTKGEAMKLMAILRAAWPRQEVGMDTAEVYAGMLSDIPFDEGKAAVTKLVQTTKFFPTVAEILEQVAESRCELDSPEMAWGEVQKAIAKVGSYHQPLFENPEIQRAVNAIGWKQICLDENLAATRARFIDAYRAARAKRIESETTGKALPSPYAELARPQGFGLEHGSFRYVRRSFPVPEALAAGEPEPAKQLVDGLARHLRIVRDDEDGEEPPL